MRLRRAKAAVLRPMRCGDTNNSDVFASHYVKKTKTKNKTKKLERRMLQRPEAAQSKWPASVQY